MRKFFNWGKKLIFTVNAYGYFLLEKSQYSSCCVSHSILTLLDPKDCSPLGSSVHGIFQARILDRVAIPFFTQQSYVLHIITILQ